MNSETEKEPEAKIQNSVIGVVINLARVIWLGFLVIALIGGISYGAYMLCLASARYGIELYQDEKYLEAYVYFDHYPISIFAEKYKDQCTKGMLYELARYLYSEGKYEEAMELFLVLEGYKDSDQYLENSDYEGEVDDLYDDVLHDVLGEDFEHREEKSTE